MGLPRRGDGSEHGLGVGVERGWPPQSLRVGGDTGLGLECWVTG